MLFVCNYLKKKGFLQKSELRHKETDLTYVNRSPNRGGERKTRVEVIFKEMLLTKLAKMQIHKVLQTPIGTNTEKIKLRHIPVKLLKIREIFKCS